jgi:hypothetical protein
MNSREIAAEYRLDHWAGIMRERIESGLSIREFCKNAGFHENMYFYWQRKLREAACAEQGIARINAEVPAPVGFAEVKLAEIPAPLQETSDRQSHVCIEISEVRITADNGYPVDKLATLIQMAVRPC